MDVKPHFYAWITSFLFFWKCCQVKGSQTKNNTWKQAVLDCYGSNSFLESNVTILKKYMGNNTEVKSIWVGSFEVLLPWIEIRGCYNIPLTCNSLDRDEMITADPALCQLKCMKRRYFAFNPAIRRCVCFDEQNIVKKESLNASLCNECSLRGNCNVYAIVYKVSDMSVEDNVYDCLSYQCESQGAIPIFNKTKCTEVRKSYCRDGSSASGSTDQPFFEYNRNCQENNFKYPLLHSENPVNLCNVSTLKILGIHIWVGVYRHRLFIDNAYNEVIQDFDQIEQYILRCGYLPANAEFVQAENCSGKHHYICASDTPMESQKDPYNSSSSSPICRAEDPDTGETDNQSAGMIVGIVVSISVIVVIIFVILAFMYRRKYTKEPLTFNTDCRNNSHTNEIDNYALNSVYQQLDNVQEKSKPYDQLQVRRNHGNVDTELTTEQTNTSFSRDEYSNTDILEYEQLDNAGKDTSTHAYDELNVTHVVKTDSINFFSKTTVTKEKYSKNESTKATAVTFEYEQLENAKRDNSLNVYDQLHGTVDKIANEQTNYRSKTTTPREQQRHDKPTEETTKINNMTVTSEYEQLDSAQKDKSVNVYDQLNVAKG